MRVSQTSKLSRMHEVRAMATAESTHVFKFVAVRSVQLATEDEARLSAIRDDRTATSAGLEKLLANLRKTTSPETALRAWSALDLSPLKPLATGWRELRSSYAGLAEGTPAPKGADAVKAAGLPGGLAADVDRLTKMAWDSLYVAHASGPDAGARLETPMAALRVLHFVALLGDDPAPPAATALTALRAIPAIAPAVDAVLRPAAPVKPASGSADKPAPHEPAGASRARQLATELKSSQELFSALTSAVPVPPVVAAEPVQPAGPWSRQRLSATTTPALRVALGDQISSEHATVLDRLGVTPTTTVPMAAQMLDRHIAMLSDEALSLVDDVAFQNHLESLSGVVSKFPVGSIPLPIAGIADVGSAPDVDVHGRIKPLGIGT